MEEKKAFNKGYRVIDGIVYKGDILVSSYISNSGYLTFSYTVGSVRKCSRKHIKICVHRMVAYQKYGDRLYDNDMVVRHYDGNKLNNTSSNILIGTQSQNMFDIPYDVRLNRSIVAATQTRRFTDIEIFDIKSKRMLGYTYKMLMGEYNISSKGTLHYILNTEYKTEK